MEPEAIGEFVEMGAGFVCRVREADDERGDALASHGVPSPRRDTNEGVDLVSEGAKEGGPMNRQHV